MKNQLVGFKCSGDMLARIDALVLVLGLKELEEEVETKNLD